LLIKGRHTISLTQEEGALRWATSAGFLLDVSFVGRVPVDGQVLSILARLTTVAISHSFVYASTVPCH
jgi:hypothetical protein